MNRYARDYWLPRLFAAAAIAIGGAIVLWLIYTQAQAAGSLAALSVGWLPWVVIPLVLVGVCCAIAGVVIMLLPHEY